MAGLLVQAVCLFALSQPVANAGTAEAVVGGSELGRKGDSRRAAAIFGVMPTAPELVVPLPSLGDPELANGSDELYRVEYFFAPDGRACFVKDNYDTVLAWPLVLDFWRWWLGALAGLSLLIAFFVFRRVFVHQRVTGRPYCRRCNYELTGNTSGKCPECGAVLADVRPIIGRSFTRRLVIRLPWLAVPAVFLVLNLLPHDIQQSGAFADDPKIVADVAKWFEWRSDVLYQRLVTERKAMLAQWNGVGSEPTHWLQAWATRAARLREVDLRTGSIGTTVFGDHFVSAAFSPDGSRMFITSFMGGTLWDVRERRTVLRIPEPPHHFYRGLPQDQIRFIGNSVVRTNAMMLTELGVIEWDLVPGTARHIKAAKDASRGTWKLTMEKPTAPGGEMSVQIEDMQVTGTEPTRLPKLGLLDKEGNLTAEWEVPHTAKRPLAEGFKYRPQDPLFYHDGRRMLLVWKPPGAFKSKVMERWDLQTRRFMNVVPLPFPLAEGPVRNHGRLLFYCVDRWKTETEHSHVLVFDVEENRLVAALEVPEAIADREHFVLFDRSIFRATVLAWVDERGDGSYRKLHALHYDLATVFAKN